MEGEFIFKPVFEIGQTVQVKDIPVEVVGYLKEIDDITLSYGVRFKGQRNVVWLYGDDLINK